jgi:hypothetical protein
VSLLTVAAARSSFTKFLRVGFQAYSQYRSQRLVFGNSLVVLLAIASLAVYGFLASLGRPHSQRMTKCSSHRTVPSAPRSSTFQSPARSGLTVVLLNVRYPVPGLASTRSRLT